MRPIASDPSHTGFALNEVFGTTGQVRLLRILTTEANGSVTSPEVAARAGLTPSGARKALRRLVDAGVVERVGAGKATRYKLMSEGRLTEEITRLFDLERESVDPGWARKRGPAASPSPGRGNGGVKANGNGVAEDRRKRVLQIQSGAGSRIPRVQRCAGVFVGRGSLADQASQGENSGEAGKPPPRERT